MSLLFIDSFDHYTALLDKYEVVNNPGGDGTVAIESGAARTGIAGLSTRRNSGGGAHYAFKAIPSAPQTMIIGFAFKPVTPRDATGFLTLNDPANTVNHITLTHDATLNVQVRRGTHAGTILGTHTVPLVEDEWHYIELKVTIDNTVGAVELRINGPDSNTLILSSVDTQNGATPDIGWVAIGNGTVAASPYYWQYDDLYILDDQGSKLNDFLGDTRVQLLLPASNGSQNDMTPLSGSNYQNVDEADPDDDTSYNSSPTPGDRDLYNITNVFPEDVHAVALNIRARKDQAGNLQHRAVIKNGASEALGPDTPLVAAYSNYQTLLEDAPGGGDWDQTKLNASEFGLDVRS